MAKRQKTKEQTMTHKTLTEN